MRNKYLLFSYLSLKIKHYIGIGYDFLDLYEKNIINQLATVD